MRLKILPFTRLSDLQNKSMSDKDRPFRAVIFCRCSKFSISVRNWLTDKNNSDDLIKFLAHIIEKLLTFKEKSYIMYK